MDGYNIRYNKSVEKNDSSQFVDIKNYTIEFFALFIYLFNDNLDMMKELLRGFKDIYLSIKVQLKDDSEQNYTKLLYSELKLFSCWIGIFPNPEEINKPIINI